VLVYEGNFENGKRSGRGKAFWSDRSGQVVQYDGYWLDGERYGTGKSFTKKGVLLYEGEWCGNKREGKGKEFSCKTLEVKFEGQYRNDLRHGYGKTRRGWCFFQQGKRISAVGIQKFVQIDAEDQRCSVCYHSLAEAGVTRLECGHHFCISCAHNLAKCPMDRETIANRQTIPLTAYLADKTPNREHRK
jgi:hypothetical protein